MYTVIVQRKDTVERVYFSSSVYDARVWASNLIWDIVCHRTEIDMGESYCYDDIKISLDHAYEIEVGSKV